LHHASEPNTGSISSSSSSSYCAASLHEHLPRLTTNASLNLLPASPLAESNTTTASFALLQSGRPALAALFAASLSAFSATPPSHSIGLPTNTPFAAPALSALLEFVRPMLAALHHASEPNTGSLSSSSSFFSSSLPYVYQQQ
jgi:hypothetical protein